MNETCPATSRMLLVGAYERDNFGDLLFLLQTEQYLPQHFEVVSAAPFGTDMTALLDRHIPAYGPLLESEEFDHIWTVGGEVGGANLRGAFRMIASDDQLRTWRSANEKEKSAMMRELTGETLIESPYMPRPAAYPKNVGASFTLNSVGFAGVDGLPIDRQQAVLEISRAADRISVRDNRSGAWLKSHGVPHTVAPDLVHTIARTRPRSVPQDESLALFQVSQPEIQRRGLHPFAEAIAKSKILARYRIRFFIAGTAPGHDSLQVYQDLAKEIHKISPTMRLEFSDKRRPYDLVDEISSASLWVGLSLHGRIISGAYGIPRVSFTKRKLDAYASTWDPDMPWGVTPDGLEAALEEALSPAVQSKASVGDDLAAEAERNIKAAISELDGGSESDRVKRRLDAVESWRQWLSAQNESQKNRLRDLQKRKPQKPEPESFADDFKRVVRRGATGALRRARRLRRTTRRTQ